MTHAETVQQFYILRWLEKHFDMSVITVELIDRYNVRITDRDDKEAIITYHSKEDITLKAL